MSRLRAQSGITLMGFIIVLAVVGFFAFLAMKLFPVYQEYFAVVSDMNGLSAEAGVSAKSPAEIRALLDRRFNVSYVESVKPEHIIVDKKTNTLQIKYEVRRELMYNLDFVAKFDKTVTLKG
ncbi:MAG: DUF4845 domain-containing protein [Lysobacteraceae bacterium]